MSIAISRLGSIIVYALTEGKPCDETVIFSENTQALGLKTEGLF